MDMEKLVAEVKEKKYNTNKYSLDDGSGAKAVECIPESAVGVKERTAITSVDDLNVSSILSASL